MVDAGGSDAFWPNGYKWALRTSEMLAEYGVGWFEEPLSPDALADFQLLREHSRGADRRWRGPHPAPVVRARGSRAARSMSSSRT